MPTTDLARRHNDRRPWCSCSTSAHRHWHRAFGNRPSRNYSAHGDRRPWYSCSACARRLRQHRAPGRKLSRNYSAHGDHRPWYSCSACARRLRQHRASIKARRPQTLVQLLSLRSSLASSPSILPHNFSQWVSSRASCSSPVLSRNRLFLLLLLLLLMFLLPQFRTQLQQPLVGLQGTPRIQRGVPPFFFG